MRAAPTTDPVQAAFIVLNRQARTALPYTCAKIVATLPIAMCKHSASDAAYAYESEMAVTEEMLAIAVETVPHFCCLVPKNARSHHRRRSGCGRQRDKMRDFRARPRAAGIRVSLFIDADEAQINAAAGSRRAVYRNPYRLLRQRRNRCGTGKRAGTYCQRRDPGGPSGAVK